MKQSCPKCKTIIEINEKDYYPGSVVDKQCPLCDTKVSFAIPAKQSAEAADVAKLYEAMAAMQRQIDEMRARAAAMQRQIDEMRALFGNKDKNERAVRSENSKELEPVVPDIKVKDAQGNETFTIGDVQFTMVYVEGGTFTMGCTGEQGGECYSYEKPSHSVTLSDYKIGETEVTQALWRAVMGTTIREQASKGTWSQDLRGEGDNYPMYYISYEDVETFIRKLNAMTGRRFRMPTEAEWEYAARGGRKSRGYKYAGSNTLGDVAWYDGNSGSATHPVKTKAANELGLYDMSGNVWEWCSDWYDSYSSGSQSNPKGPGSGSNRVLRGGSWGINARSCRVSYRSYNTPSSRDDDLGFRLALQ